MDLEAKKKPLVGEAEAPQSSSSNGLTENAGKAAPFEIIGEISAPPADAIPSPAVEAGPVPEGFNAEYARLALTGLHNLWDPIYRAFDWSLSAQGRGYWNELWFRLRAGVPLPDEAASILRTWIEQTEARS